MIIHIRKLVGAILVAFFTLAPHAAESAAGTWKWSFSAQNGEAIDSTMVLKQDGEKLTGNVANRFGKAEITEGSIKDSQLAFKIKREANGAEFTVQYSGKLEGDKIIGKSEYQRDGQSRERAWEAKREPAKTAAAAGSWNTALILPDGNKIESTLKLKQEGDKLTGAAIRNDNETQIQDGKITGDEITFKILRDREGRTVTARYKGKITGDTVKGKVESDWSGDWETLDWEGARAK
jgi:hypothetical protein